MGITGKILKGLVEVARDAKGVDLDDCPGKTDMGVRCKKKRRPGYGGCGRPHCSSSFDF